MGLAAAAAAMRLLNRVMNGEWPENDEGDRNLCNSLFRHSRALCGIYAPVLPESGRLQELEDIGKRKCAGNCCSG
jgi:hypothetical protein